MKLSKLEQYYCKFNEDKRLLSRHGQVEFNSTMNYIKKYLKAGMCVVDIGAGTGRYSVEIANLGCKVTAVELVKQNLTSLKKNVDKFAINKDNINYFQGTALNLKKLADNTFDITLVFGPMYHVFTLEDKLKVLTEAKRITKPNGIIFVAYYMNEYAVITHGFKDNNIVDNLNNQMLTNDFKVKDNPDTLYSMERLTDIDNYNKLSNLKRIKIIAPDGPTDYLRPVINQMDEKTFEIYKSYVLSIAERKDLLGASSHLVDILRNIKQKEF